MSVNPHKLLGDIADAFDECADEEGQWDGADICDAVAGILIDHGYLTRCDECNLLHSSRKDTCPWLQPGH